ncbi:hypothetical protein [Streptomyces beihaiensis]|uniref:Uncharacterized protein n=1 Tax=Streptomyces beihaiensis TaxID=2984495 RepID=A0ABT3TMI5_9ACTN|nr:hypothetical protein [Streptomyces beihaiensis]MCX3058253.1 hypothetical protein [Streptomyces beihaiensis]
MRTANLWRSTIIASGLTAAIGIGAASGAVAATHTAPAAATAEQAVAHGKAKRTYVKTVRLAAPAHIAKVYKLGKNKYQADILYKGKKFAVLNASGKTDRANLNGLHVKLTAYGTLTSWADRAKPNPKPKPKPKPAKRELIRVDTLADGTSAKIYRLSANHWQADLQGVGMLDANGRPAVGEHNGMHVVLSPDGRLSSWTDETPAPDPTPTPDPTPDPDGTDNGGADTDGTASSDTNPKQQPRPDAAAGPNRTPVAPSTDPGQARLAGAA